MRPPGYAPRSVGFEKVRPPSARSKVSVRGVPACGAGAGAGGGAPAPLGSCGPGAPPGAAVAVGFAPSAVEVGEALPLGPAEDAVPGVALEIALAVPLLVALGVAVPPS